MMEMVDVCKSMLPFRRAAVLQFAPGRSLAENLRRADALITRAVDEGATLIGLPEVFTMEYQKHLFRSAAESVALESVLSEGDVPATGSQLLAARAEEHEVTIFGGIVEQVQEGVPEKDEVTLYNSIVAYGPSGKLLALYRKVHLSCVRAGPDKTSEADVFCPGRHLVQFTAPSSFGGGTAGIWRPRVGLGICFDLRFDLHRAYVRGEGSGAGGCEVMAYPSAFLESTGQDHWELLLRARALEEQIFVLAPNHSRSGEQETKMFGHAMICGPWGQILASTGQAEGDCLAVADLAPQQLGECRSRIPLRSVRSATPALSVASLAEVLTTSKQRTDKLAEELCRARQKGGRYLEGNLPELTSPREAYAVQAATVKLAPGMGLGEVVGWKCGPCGQADYLKFGLSGPGAAPVFASGRSESPATLDFSPGSPASLTKLEAEFGFLMKHDLPPLKAAGGSETYSEEQVWAAVDCVVLCMEVCGSRYKPDVQAKLTGYQKMADCTNNLGVVLGPRVSKADLERALGSPGAAALSSVEVSLSMNGLALDRGKGSVGVVEGPDGGSPLNSLVWLANHLQSEGLGLKGGEVVVCGAACKVGAKDFNFDAGGKAEFVADFKGLGQVLAIVRRSNASDAARPDRSRSPRR